MDGVVRFYTITEQHEGQRVDNFLIRHLKGVPKSHLYRLLSNGQIRVNKKRTKPDYKLQLEDILRVPPIRTSQGPIKTIPEKFIEILKKSVLFEDENLLILNKPPGMAVHAGSGVSVGLIETVREWRGEPYLELAHRIDRETSGCVMLAKNRKALLAVHQLFQEHQIKKTYLAILRGQVSFETKLVTTPVMGKEAETLFVLLKTDESKSFVEAYPQSGRTHQIRVHAIELGHPILGDVKYGDESDDAGRLFLHAYKLHFMLNGKEISVMAETPDDFELLLKKFLV